MRQTEYFFCWLLRTVEFASNSPLSARKEKATNTKMNQSVTPVCVSERRTVELVPMHAPLRHEPVHQIPKPIVVTTLDQLNHLMHHDVLKAGCRFLCQFKIQPDSAGGPLACPPAGLHPLDANLGDVLADHRFPF